jgi:exonuclease SbcD
MKFLHLADLHLGKTVNGFSMIPDQKFVLSEAMNLIEKRKIDAVLIAGDVYDKKIPTEEAVELFDDFLSELSEKNVPALIISGNHDSDERLNFGSRLFDRNNIYIAGKYNGTIKKVTLKDKYGPVNFYLLPFIQRIQAERFFPDDDTSTYEAAVRTVLKHTDVDFNERNVILAHQFVTGASTPELSGSETSAKSVGTVDEISYTVLDGFNYAALGHIHRPQHVGRKEIRYGGSPVKYSLNEINQDKAFTIIELKEKGKPASIRTIPVKPLHEMRELRGPLEELVKPENIKYPDDYVFATLTDEMPVPDAFEIIRSHYKNIMGLRYDNTAEKKAEETETITQESVRTFSDMMQEFYKKILGTDPTEEEWNVLKETAEEAGIEELQ